MSTEVLLYTAVALGNYLVGSIPFSYFIAKIKSVDLRSVGSGNIGATNVARSIGIGYGLLALLFDMLKGVAAAAVVTLGSFPVFLSAFAVFGHNWSLFLGFKAGKGVATTLGILLILHWPTFLIAVGVWGAIALATRYVSLSSVVALLSAPLVLYLWVGQTELAAFMLVLALISLFQHRENFRKLTSGSEHKI